MESRKTADWQELAEENGMATSQTMHIAQLIRTVLEEEKDEGTHIDRGAGFGMVDMWVKYGGREYLVTVKEACENVSQ